MLRKKSSKVICATLFLLFGKDLITLKRESSFQKSKNAPQGYTLARRCNMSQATALGARMCIAHSFL